MKSRKQKAESRKGKAPSSEAIIAELEDYIRNLQESALFSIECVLQAIEDVKWTGWGKELEGAGHLALAACRSMVFATENASRHGGDWNLNDLLSAHKLANEALALQTKAMGGGKQKAESRKQKSEGES